MFEKNTKIKEERAIVKNKFEVNEKEMEFKLQAQIFQKETTAQEEKLKVGTKLALAKQNVRLEADINLAKNEFEREKQAAEITVKKEQEFQKVEEAKLKTRQIGIDFEIKELNSKHEMEMKQMAAELKVKKDGYSENVLKSMVIENTEKIYKHLRIDSMKVVNVGGEGGKGQDSAGQLMANMMASYKSITEGLKD